MNKLYTLLLIAFIVILLPGLSIQAQANVSAEPQPASLQWAINPEQARQAMLFENKPGMFYFYAHDSLQSYEMQTMTFKDPMIITDLQGIIPVAVDVTKHRRVAEAFGVYRVPTVVFTDSAAREIDRTIGFKSSSVLTAHINRVRRAVSQNENDSLIPKFQKNAIDILKPRPDTQPFTVVFPDPNREHSQIFLVGDFNNWNNSEVPMLYRNGHWGLTVHLEVGQIYQYILFTDKGEYLTDPGNPYGTISDIETFNNVMVIGSVRTSPIVEKNATTFLIYNPEAVKVEVAGDFSGWTPIELFQNPNDKNFWGRKIQLPQGTFQYKLLIDEVWQVDPLNYTPWHDGTAYNSTFVIK